MDRREALTKLVAGGAITVGAASIISSPAFADTTPTTPTVTVVMITAEQVARFDTTALAPACSGGSDGTGTANLVSASLNPDGTVGAISSSTTLTALATNPAGKFRSGDTARLNVRTSSICSFSNEPDDSAVVKDYEFNFTYSGGNDKTFLPTP